MALMNGNDKPAQKTAVSWFEFLFDTNGEVLKKHLEDTNAGFRHIHCCFSVVLFGVTTHFLEINKQQFF